MGFTLSEHPTEALSPCGVHCRKSLDGGLVSRPSGAPTFPN